jgi:hypothetical protein
VEKEAWSASRLEALRQELAGDDAGSPWWRLVAEVVAEWRDGVADATAPVDAAIEQVWEVLAERRREPSFGDGVRLLTVHAAKGLEFRHVAVNLRASSHSSVSELERLNEKRLRLLARKHGGASFPREDEARLEILQERLLHLLPSVEQHDFEKLEGLAAVTRGIRERHLERMNRLQSAK